MVLRHKKRIHYLKIDLKRAFYIRNFWVSVIATFGVWMVSGLQIQGKKESVFSLMENILYGNGGIFMLIFVLAAIPYSTAFCDDMESGYIHYAVIRGDLKHYVVSKITAIYISSLLAETLGTFMFFLFYSFKIPWITENTLLMAGCVEFLEQNLYIIWFFLFAAFWGAWFATLSVIASYGSLYVRNRLFTWSIPILVNQLLIETNSFGLGSDIYFNFPNLYNLSLILGENESVLIIWAVLVSLLISSIFGGLVYRKLKNHM